MQIKKEEAAFRDCGLDNLKAFLILCVVFGHVLEEISMEGLYGIIRSVIYSFHMPAFIFLSGYFSKNFDRTYADAVRKCLLPFLLFNTLWSVLSGKTLCVNLFLPVYVFWYLLSLFFWRISIKALLNVRGIFVISVALSIYAGWIDSADRFLSVSRTVSFFPFFIAGALTDEELLERIRRIPHWICTVIFVFISALTAFFNSKLVIPVKMYEFIQSYAKCGVPGWEGGVQRMWILVSALVLTGCLVNLAGIRKTSFTEFGERTACIYLISGFVMKGLFFWGGVGKQGL